MLRSLYIDMVGRYLSAYHFGGGQCQGRFQDIGAVGLEFLVAAAVSTGVSMLAHSDKKPNILVLMGDAIGWENLGSYR